MSYDQRRRSTFEANDVVGCDRPEARGPGAVRETAKQSVSQLFHGPAPRSPLHRLAVRPNTPERQKRQNAPKLGTLLRAMVHSAPRAQTTAHLRRQRRARNRSSTSLRRTCTFRLEAAGNSFSKLNHARTESGPGAVPAGRPLVPLPASPVPANNVAEATGDTGPAGIARDGTSPVAPRPTRDRSKTERVCRSNTRPDVEDAGYRSLPQ